MEVDETYPDDLRADEIALFLSKLKSEAFKDELGSDELLITADTIVCLDDQVIEKPTDRDHAVAMLKDLSGNTHTVYTAVTIKDNRKEQSFQEATRVTFKELDDDEIDYYLDHYKPYDKAGSYGIQEWIGYVAIERIEGCFYNVMGLPVRQVYEALCAW